MDWVVMAPRRRFIPKDAAIGLRIGGRSLSDSGLVVGASTCVVVCRWFFSGVIARQLAVGFLVLADDGGDVGFCFAR